MPITTLTAGSEGFSTSSEPIGLGTVGVRATGEIDLLSAPVLDQALRAAVGAAPLTVLDLRDVTFMDCSGLHVVLQAARDARAAAGRLVVLHMRPEVELVFSLTGTSGKIDLIPERRAGPALGDGVGAAPPRPANPVNGAVLAARVMAVPDRQLWLQAGDGEIQRAWAPAGLTGEGRLGHSVEVYVDGLGEINGWWDPASGLAVNQRHLDRTASPSDGDPMACQGRCGVVWQAPAAEWLVKLDERCLTCAGELAPG